MQLKIKLISEHKSCEIFSISKYRTSISERFGQVTHLSYVFGFYTVQFCTGLIHSMREEI